MLQLLSIRNIALIDEAVIEFGRGLNLLTGETGSGKSIIVDSLGALTGDRTSSELVKTGCETGEISAIFNIEGIEEVTNILADAGIAGLENETELIIRREISSNGRSRSFINDRPVTVGLLRRIGQYLVEIFSQGEQSSIYNVSVHRDILDEFGGLEGLRSQVSKAYKEYLEVRKLLDEIDRDEAEKLRLADSLKFQIEELTRAALSIEEEAALEEEKKRLNNIEKLTELSTRALSEIYEDEKAAYVLLKSASDRIAELSFFDKRFLPYNDTLSGSIAVLDELARDLMDFSSTLEFDPQRLEAVESRLQELSQIKRKYGGSIEAAIEHLKSAEQRLSDIEHTEERRTELAARLDKAKNGYLKLAGELSKKRHQAGALFARQVTKELPGVALEKARFEVTLTEEISESEDNFSPNGLDRIEFMFSANPGEQPKPLVRIASGGESSRLMLILKSVASKKRSAITNVFDEIDTGIGGKAADYVGAKLLEYSKATQILCVTHQPQIASKADHHFLVEKNVSRGRTVISVKPLDENG
ncbi:MAG TPA: DNA repair protein RecN, partial [Pyrinomonadaceae bacterium]|nr:DNA repair protein RecN [Pyrinomonadaceae bacterium]